MKFLMVCLGNICRSPLAEGLLASKVPAEIVVDSAGTADYHVGEKPDLRSIAVAQKNGIDISHQRARQFSVQDFDNFDHIFVMDASNHVNVLKLARNANDQEKVKLILNEINPGRNEQVPDPWFGKEKGFDDVYEMLDIATDKIVENYLK
ncbi:MAG: low molecular weight protein-tyrosine-phosphatase [Flavobacteriaceae bacterium]|nr:low molecular weight protein-tyrosine-phosphatase [Flavobacteriaceae bacterium]